jgi:hypothetical protein
MALQIRRGSESGRGNIRFNSGELIFTTDNKDLWVGDGSTDGGIRVAPIRSINGLVGVTGPSNTGALTLTTDNITEGATNKYYSSTQARIDAGAALVAGNVGNDGISFTYNSGNNSITAVVNAGGYSLPTAAPTELGGVKISQGGLAIDGAGLLSVITPVGTGTAGQLTYYTGTNSVSQTGGDLVWALTDSNYPKDGVGAKLTVGGTVYAQRVDIGIDLLNGGFKIDTQASGASNIDLFTINTCHTDEDAAGAIFTRSRGTIASPLPIQASDTIFKLVFGGKTTAGFEGIGGIAVAMLAEADGTVSSGVLPGKFSIFTANAAGELTPGLTIDKSQTVSFTGAVKLAQVSGTLPSAPEAGMIVLDGTTFKGYNGSAWVTLG